MRMCSECQQAPCGSTRCYCTVVEKRCQPAQTGEISPGAEMFLLKSVMPTATELQVRMEEPLNPDRTLASFDHHQRRGSHELSPPAAVVMATLRHIQSDDLFWHAIVPRKVKLKS